MVASRRLAAILAADVVGYSRLMGADEEGTLRRLMMHRRELIDPKIAEHGGRIVKTTGDGLLAEFPSIVEAVRCAAEMQRAMADRDTDLMPDRRVRFRIGINLGDMIVEDDDLFGDGVNVAARLEALAEPGGIYVSRSVHDQIYDKLPYVFEDLGEQNLRNIARPVRTYALSAHAVALLPVSPEPLAIAAAPLPAAPRLSIVVLPFANLSNDADQEYFADGITEDLTTDLSRIEGMVVISRNTAFTYKGKSADAKQIGRELSVRYMLEGSVRRLGPRIRINAQLIDANSAAHLWAERFDRDADDLLAMQDEITTQIALALKLEVIDADAARPNSAGDALDYILRGRAALNKPFSPESYQHAIGQFERALALDPQSVEAQSLLATALVARVLNFRPRSSNSDLERADALAARALTASPRSAMAHFARGQALRARGRYREAIREYETVLALDRNWVAALSDIGRCKIFVGPIDEAILAQEQAIRLSPRDPNIALRYFRIGQAHLIQSRLDDAIEWLEKACVANAAPAFLHAYLASAYALKGEGEHAASELAEARRLNIAGLDLTIASYRRGIEFAIPEIRALFEVTFFEGLRRAGMPES